jgi:hypothetical protein
MSNQFFPRSRKVFAVLVALVAAIAVIVAGLLRAGEEL